MNEELTKRMNSGDLLKEKVNADLKEKIKRCMLEQSNDMFNYAVMQIDHLCDEKMNKITVFEELDKPLLDYTSLYHESVEQIKNDLNNSFRVTAQNTLK